ncbi:MAG: Crp/Fnr family transcriptional regulator [Polyangiaceae bacterium]|nr:Crp/Fnr family transcriptional regulator [Polyangiaceae bacterium]MBK8942184.1 Crp/Fnr family transcriptional regulator [Polyangiaceae bacterium]
MAIRDPACAKCPIGAASGVGRGECCVMLDRSRRAGANLFVEGEPAEKVWFVKRGLVSLSRAVDARAAAVWTLRRPGSILGLEGLQRPTYLDTANAVTDVVVCVASKDAVQAWLARRSGAALALLGCVVEAQCTDAPRRAGADGNSVVRVATWLLDAEAQNQAIGAPRAVIAGLLGMEPETLSRALAALASRGLVQVSRKSVSITDRAGLSSLAEGEVKAPYRKAR